MNLFAPLAPWPFAPLPYHHFNLLVIDPPWSFTTYSEEGEEKSAAAHYETMSMADIQALPMGDLADPNCLALVWVTAPTLPDGVETLRRWGFIYKSFLHWTKVFASGKPAIGTGYRVRTMGELVLVGVKGNPNHKPLPGNFPGVRREHSRKPEEFYGLIDKCCPALTRRADIFSRQSRPGWATWGQEATKFDGEG